MDQNESIILFNEQIVQKKYNDYLINIKEELDSIIISVSNSKNLFESKFNLEYLHSFKLLVSSFTVEEVTKFISGLIEQKNIQIEEKENNLKFILISTLPNHPNVELDLKGKEIYREKNIEQLIQEIKEENKNLKKLFQEEIKQLNNKIKLIEEENKYQKEEIKQLNNKIKLIEEENKYQKEEIKKLNIKTKLNEEENKYQKEEIKKVNNKIKVNEEENKYQKEEIKKVNNKIKVNEEENKYQKEKKNKINSIEIEKRLKSSVELYNNKEFSYNKEKTIQYHKISKLKMIDSLEINEHIINKVSIFPSGNIISVSRDQSIKIYDIYFKIIQNIPNAHPNWIYDVNTKDDNNFITSSYKDIKLWIKKDNLFKYNKSIENAHNDWITKVMYYGNKKIISCSWDKTVKIWEEKYDGYKNIQTLTHSNKIYSMLLLENKNVLISGGIDGTKLWKLSNFDLIYHFQQTVCGNNNTLCRINEDLIIVYASKNNSHSLKILSISQKSIIKEISYPFFCYGIQLIKDKGLILTGGVSKDIIIYRSDNYECFQTITNAHEDNIFGFIELKDGTIISYGKDKNFNLWSF